MKNRKSMRPLPLSGWKGGETGDGVGPPPPEPAPTVRAADYQDTPPPSDPPSDSMAAVFELGATQEALQQCRREVAECQAETSRLSGDVVGLAAMVETLSTELAEVRAEEQRRQQQQQQEVRAGWLDRMLGGH